jgi:hypothetical protein
LGKKYFQTGEQLSKLVHRLRKRCNHLERIVALVQKFVGYVFSLTIVAGFYSLAKRFK